MKDFLGLFAHRHLRQRHRPARGGRPETPVGMHRAGCNMTPVKRRPWPFPVHPLDYPTPPPPVRPVRTPVAPPPGAPEAPF